MKQVRLNRVEVWIADHALPIFGVVALAIVAGAIAITLVFMQAQEAGDQVNVLKPQVTRVSKAICDQESLDHPNRARSCAERIRVGLVNCRRVPRCRAAFLAIGTYPPPAKPTSTKAPSSTTAPSSEGGDAIHQPSHQGHQPPGPGKGPSGGNGGNGQGGGEEASPAPSGPPAAEDGPPAETPGNGAQGSQGGSSSSGADVELCVLEHTCVGAEVGLGGL